MAVVVFVRVVWDRSALPFRMPGTRWFDLHVGPEPGAPFGRKGKAIAAAWRQLATPAAAGMLLLDGDTAVDPADYVAMMDAVEAEPGAVHVAPVRLWPASTQRESWVWGHWENGAGPGQQLEARPDRFTFGFTYLPRRLLALAAAAGLARWEFPGVDMRMSQTAARHRIPARLVDGCHPKHMHY